MWIEINDPDIGLVNAHLSPQGTILEAFRVGDYDPARETPYAPCTRRNNGELIDAHTTPTI